MASSPDLPDMAAPPEAIRSFSSLRSKGRARGTDETVRDPARAGRGDARLYRAFGCFGTSLTRRAA